MISSPRGSVERAFRDRSDDRLFCLPVTDPRENLLRLYRSFHLQASCVNILSSYFSKHCPRPILSPSILIKSYFVSFIKQTLLNLRIFSPSPHRILKKRKKKKVVLHNYSISFQSKEKKISRSRRSNKPINYTMGVIQQRHSLDPR